MRFWDSSAILPLLLSEPQSAAMMALYREDSVMLTWWNTPVECVSAIARLERDQAVDLKIVADALGRLSTLQQEWQEIQPVDAVRTTASRLLRTHALRAADALQLAAAIVATEHKPADMGFVCLDKRLALAAHREGFAILGL